MNAKFKLIRLVLAAAIGSLLWAGCASPRANHQDASAELAPVDLLTSKADTHSKWQAGLNNSIRINPAVDEAAGAQR